MRIPIYNHCGLHATRKILFIGAVVLYASIFSACKKEINPVEDGLRSGKNNNNSIENEIRFNTRVTSGHSIQAAIDAAHPGYIILIDPGVYKEAIVVDKPGIVLIGSGNGVIIQNPGDEENGITVNDRGDGFVLKNVTVRDFEENGVILQHVNGFVISHVTTINNGEYGLFPLLCMNGVIDHCTASGHSDTGIYVGQSSNIVMTDNTAFENVNGLEVENSKNVIVTLNHSYNNVAGIAIILLPGLTVKAASEILVFKNNVVNNNHPNFAPPSGGFESLIPSGVGIFILGADRVTLKENTVTGNKTLGVATVSTLLLGALAGLPPEAFADIEPNPDGTKIISNVITGNGTAPAPGSPFPGVDLLWDGSGIGNCWKLNTFGSSYPSPLPTCL